MNHDRRMRLNESSGNIKLVFAMELVTASKIRRFEINIYIYKKYIDDIFVKI